MLTLTDFEHYLSRVLGGTVKKAVIVEQSVIDFVTPLAQQIQAQALILGKQDLAIGLQVLKDGVATGVAAGAAALATGGNPVAAAETAFLTTAAGEGKTALNNAESAAIKVGVALAQQTVAALAPTPPTT